MGKIIEEVTVQNYVDIFQASKKLIPETDIRSVTIEALVDTGAAYLCLPANVIETLGLLYSHTAKVKTANGVVEKRIFGSCKITIQQRNVQMEVMENDNQTPPLIGYLILEALDFVIDPKSQRLIGNPEHDGTWMVDLY